MVLLIQGHWLAYYCAFFTIIPHILSNIVCLVRLQTWREGDPFIYKYVDRYDWFIILVSVIAGYVILCIVMLYFPICVEYYV